MEYSKAVIIIWNRFTALKLLFPVLPGFPDTWMLLYILDCVKTYSGASGYVFHKNYPRRYKNIKHCLYVVRVAPGYAVELDFKIFELEISPQCQNDYVTVYDGADNKAKPLTEKLCGKKNPGKIRATGNTVAIAMKTNENINGPGFVALYRRIAKTVLPTRVGKISTEQVLARHW